MSKQDQGSLTGPSTSKQVLKRDMLSRAGQTRVGNNRKDSSEIGELKLKIRRLQKELAKVNTVGPRARVVNPRGRDVRYDEASRSGKPRVRRASSSVTSLHNIQRRQRQLAIQTGGIVKGDVEVKPQPINSALYRVRNRVPYATATQPPPVGSGATTATAVSSASSVTSSIAIGATGKPGLPKKHQHKCRFMRKSGIPCDRMYEHEHNQNRVDHDQQIGDCPYTDCMNHNAAKVLGNKGVQIDVVESLPKKFVAPHRTEARMERPDDPEAVKPLKTASSVPIDTMRNKGDFLQKVKRPQRVAPSYADCDLVHLLRVEYAFKVRSANMLPLMAAKCKQYLAKYDCTQLTAKDQYNLIISAVSAAMEISPLEEQVRQSLRNSEGNMARVKQARMLRDGVLGNKLFGPPDRLPSGK